MDVERALISQVIATQSMDVEALRIGPEHFVTKAVGEEPAPGDVWDWMLAHLRRYRAVPSRDIFMRRWPKYVLIATTDPVSAIVEEFVKTVKRRQLIEEIRHLSKIADDWSLVGDADVHMFESARELARVVPGGEVTRFSDSFNRLKLYEERERTGKTPGVSTLIQEVDDFTYGIQRDEMMIIEGFLNIGKSSMGIGMAAKAYFERDETPLVLSLEMEGQKLANRWDAYAAGISYRAMKRMELEPHDKEKWHRIAEKASDSKLEKDIIVIDDLYRPSIERVFAEVERWRPNWTLVDTIDEIDAPKHLRSSYERQGYAARELKAIARHLKRPIIGVAQAGREAEEVGATLSNIANSIDIARKADIIVGLHASPRMQQMNQMEIRLLKNRDDEGKGKSWNYYVDIGGMEWRPWRESDAIPERPVTV